MGGLCVIFLDYDFDLIVIGLFNSLQPFLFFQVFILPGLNAIGELLLIFKKFLDHVGIFVEHGS